MATITGPVDIDFRPDGDFFLSLAGGTTITAEIQYKDTEGTYQKVTDSMGLSDITGDYDEKVLAPQGVDYRLSVSAATGTWSYRWQRAQAR